MPELSQSLVFVFQIRFGEVDAVQQIKCGVIKYQARTSDHSLLLADRC
jgi:hypothetical protein